MFGSLPLWPPLDHDRSRPKPRSVERLWVSGGHPARDRVDDLDPERMTLPARETRTLHPGNAED
jgi:hypothetical protein